MFEERIEFAIGRMAIANEFTHSEIYDYYVSSAIDGFDGVILIGELGYMRNGEETSKGLPGNYKFGGFYNSAKFDKVSDGSDSGKANYGLYWLVDQMVYRESGERDQGLTPWAAVTLSVPQDINTFPFFVSGGFVYKGLFPDRDSDVTAFGFAYGKVSDDIEGKDYELMFELTYIFELAEWLQFQPDVQIIVHPGGGGDIPDALVIGTQISVDI